MSDASLSSLLLDLRLTSIIPLSKQSSLTRARGETAPTTTTGRSDALRTLLSSRVSLGRSAPPSVEDTASVSTRRPPSAWTYIWPSPDPSNSLDTPSFIHSPKKAASYCLHPALAPFSPVLALQPEPIDVQTRPVPHLTSRTGLSGLASDILVLGINNKIRTNGANGEVPWDQKHGHGIFWVRLSIFCSVLLLADPKIFASKRGPSPEFDEPLTAMNAVKISSPVRLMLLSSTPIDHYTFPSTLISPLNVVDAGLVPSSSRKHSKKQYNFKVNTEERISSDIWTRGNYLDVAFTGYGLSCDGLPGCDGLVRTSFASCSLVRG